MDKPVNVLTEEEQKLPFAKYFYDVSYEDITQCPQKLIDLGKAPIPQERILRIEDINRLLDPEYDADDEGYGTFEDGTGYVAMRMFYPGCTKDMFEWWFAWHGIQNARYKIWDPRSHYGVHVSRRSLAQRCDQKLNWKERNWNTTDYVTAWTVDGVQTTKIAFLSPGDFGFDTELMKKTGASAVSCIGGHPDLAVLTNPSTRVLHETADGLKVFLYFWFGYTILGGKAVKVPGFVCKEAIPKLQVTHCAEEYHHLGKLLADVYRENSVIPDSPEQFETMPF